jgi:hypothetical protein
MASGILDLARGWRDRATYERGGNGSGRLVTWLEDAGRRLSGGRLGLL